MLVPATPKVVLPRLAVAVALPEVAAIFRQNHDPLPLTSGRVILDEGLERCEPTGLRGRRALDVTESVEPLSGMKRQIKDRVSDLFKDSREGIRVRVAHRAGGPGTDMNGAFQRVTLGPKNYPPNIRERTQ